MIFKNSIAKSKALGRHKTAVFWALTAVLGLLAGVLTFFIGMQQSIWFDEAHTLLLAHQSVPELIRLAAADVHPPLYFLIVKLWAGLFGWSDVSLRLLGAGMAVLLVGAVALLAKTLFGKRAGLLAASFVAISPFVIRYDFELRMYSLAASIAVIATYVLVKAVAASSRKQSTWLWLPYAILVAVGMYTVYYTAFIWLGHAIWLGMQWYTARRKGNTLTRQRAFYGLAAYVVAVLLWSPWLLVFITQLTNGALANITEPLTAANTLSFLTFSFLYQPFGRLTMVQSLLFWGMIIALVMLVLYARRAKHMSRFTSLSVTVLLTPFAVLALVSLVKPLYVERYLVPVVPFFFVTLAGLSAYAYGVNKKVTKWLVAGLLALCVVGLVQLTQVGNFNFQRNERPATWQAVSYIESQCQNNTIILSNDPYIYIQSLPYYTAPCQFFFYEPSQTLGGGYAGVSGSAWQIKSPASIGSPARIVYVYYDTPAVAVPGSYTQVEQRSIGNLHIVTYVNGAEVAE